MKGVLEMKEKHLFYDELGNKVEFFVKGKFTLNDTDYVALLPTDDISSMTYILKIDIDDNGEEMLVGIDDDELERAREVYEELLKEDLQ